MYTAVISGGLRTLRRLTAATSGSLLVVLLWLLLLRSYSTPGPVSTWMGDHLRTDKPPRYVTSHPGQLSLAIPPWVGAMNTSEIWGVNGHTAIH